jgi:hypothetical protein
MDRDNDPTRARRVCSVSCRAVELARSQTYVLRTKVTRLDPCCLKSARSGTSRHGFNLCLPICATCRWALSVRRHTDQKTEWGTRPSCFLKAVDMTFGWIVSAWVLLSVPLAIFAGRCMALKDEARAPRTPPYEGRSNLRGRRVHSALRRRDSARSLREDREGHHPALRVLHEERRYGTALAFEPDRGAGIARSLPEGEVAR